MIGLAWRRRVSWTVLLACAAVVGCTTNDCANGSCDVYYTIAADGAPVSVTAGDDWLASAGSSSLVVSDATISDRSFVSLRTRADGRRLVTVFFGIDVPTTTWDWLAVPVLPPQFPCGDDPLSTLITRQVAVSSVVDASDAPILLKFHGNGCGYPCSWIQCVQADPWSRHVRLTPASGDQAIATISIPGDSPDAPPLRSFAVPLRRTPQEPEALTDAVCVAPALWNPTIDGDAAGLWLYCHDD